MQKILFKLTIEGDYIDSFIYMGVLYLLDTDLNVKSYSWKDVCNYLIHRNGFKNPYAHEIIKYVEDNHINISSKDPITTAINSNELLKLEKDSVNINTWPSDINIYSNKLYFSGDDGVYYILTDHQKKGFSNKKHVKVFGMKSFSISPNSYGRIALATGDEGVFTSCHFFDSRGKIESQISKKSCIDIDWVDYHLFVNTDNVSVKQYENITNFTDFRCNQLAKINELNTSEVEELNSNVKSEHREYLKKALNKKPLSLNINKYFKYGWSSGSCDFLITHDDVMKILDKKTNNVDSKKLNDNFPSFFKVRTSGCGTIIENNSHDVFLYDGDKITELAKDIVSWRVYPRARTHARHLHIVNNDSLIIHVFDNSETASKMNSFSDQKDPYKYNPILKLMKD
ncbi:hypothetical protein AU490_13740 [Lonsdalea populi]|uniref:hypothetical protein n=1 Tax=Lonsdalea TaxID=1082702 RepID=UPI000DCA3E0C|nr:MULTISPECIES: hypothetical protein [Lonsdalea]RAT17404.1 hypothetical protein AU486_04570 [Lonsdalea quercina]RAT26536.1 hypothetical protein AU490_13740 [Lonsdalea populi]RAT36280.1 hypothetical protein AU491_06875 [Lonsdalea populi]RAT46940.1 hypothetical protein AU496_07570 [Lonsdalea populi]RAT53302.1 hypothetical protein AU498_06840 [Lonsdalea populi]